MMISAATISRQLTQWIERLMIPFIHRARDHIISKIQPMYSIIVRSLSQFGSIIFFLSLIWLGCSIRGFDSFLHMGTTSYFTIVWCGVLSMCSMVGLAKFSMISAVAIIVTVLLGSAYGLLAIAIFGLVLLWLYGSFWITLLFIFFGGLAFILGGERIALFIIAIYSVYSAWGYVGWLGLILAYNLAFISTDAFVYFLKINLNQQNTADGSNHQVDGSSFESGSGLPGDRGPGVTSTSGTESELSAEDEVARLLSCTDHYSAMGLSRYESVDAAYLKREYRKKAMLVHPDKNMGNEKSAEAFKKLQNAYEVLLDPVNRKSYDEELKKEELLNYLRRFKNTSKTEHVPFGGSEDGGEAFIESRRITCRKCGHSHVWFLTKKLKYRARWCQDCKEFHSAKDGDGWIEQSSDRFFLGLFEKMDTPRAYVCADGKIYNACEWYICQGMRSSVNTHKASFHVNTSMIFSKHSSGRRRRATGPRGNQRKPNYNNVEETMTEDEFYEWVQTAVHNGGFDPFSETFSSKAEAEAKAGSSKTKKKEHNG